MFQEALMNCKLRGGILAMPKTSNTNRLMADYITQAGLTRVYIGVKAQSHHTVSAREYLQKKLFHFPVNNCLVFSSIEWNKQLCIHRLKPSPGLFSLEPRQGHWFPDDKLKLCGAAQLWDMGPY